MNRSGQSLVEVLVAIAVAAILFVGTASLIAPTLTINKTTSQIQISVGLGRAMLTNVQLLSENDWHSLLNLATGSANQYYIITSSSPFTAATGTQSIVIATTTYTRAFYLSDVYRDANGYVTSTVGTCIGTSPCYDPSTKQVNITYGWTRGITTTIITNLTRNNVYTLDQTDWSGGPGQNGPETTTNSQFSTSTSISYTSVPGSIVAQPPATLWPNGYIYRRTITATSSLVAPSGTTLSNFPMLISNTYSYLAASSSGGSLQNPKGYDVIFTSDASGSVPLSYERESYSSSTGVVNYWVNVPVFSASTNTIYMFYDNSSISSDQSNATGTWDSHYQLIAHLAGNPGLSLVDSTGNVGTGTNGGATGITGEIDGGANFVSASSEYVNFGAPVATQITNNITLEGWFLTTTTPSVANIGIVNQFQSAIGNHYGIALGLNTNAAGLISANSIALGIGNGISTELKAGTSASMNDGNFHDYVGTFSSGTYQIYADGNRILNTSGSNTSTAYNGSALSFYLGRTQAGGGFFDGNVDEVRVSNVVRSSDWIATEYNNESSPGTFYSVGSATSYGGNVPGSISTSTGQYWAWNDAIGWIDFSNSSTVTVSSNGLSAYASSSIGDISLDCSTTRNGNICGTSNYQVLNDGAGDLSGWAWNDAIGWISFCGGQSSSNCPGAMAYQTTIQPAGDFQGWAWNDAVGWIDFNCDNNGSCGTSNFEVKTTWAPPSATSTGQLDSTTFDTGVATGVQLNSIMWWGSPTSGSTVQFQIAASNSSSGPWVYTGSDGSSNTYYTPAASGQSLNLSYTAFNNFRYFRYRTFILYANGTSSRVDDVVVNWSP